MEEQKSIKEKMKRLQEKFELNDKKIVKLRKRIRQAEKKWQKIDERLHQCLVNNGKAI